LWERKKKKKKNYQQASHTCFQISNKQNQFN
jgi:hypothetical protein